jgi:hypothetical protein
MSPSRAEPAILDAGRPTVGEHGNYWQATIVRSAPPSLPPIRPSRGLSVSVLRICCSGSTCFGLTSARRDRRLHPSGFRGVPCTSRGDNDLYELS